MTMSAGSVTVADNESATGTGAAYAIYQATVSYAVDLSPLVAPTLGQTTPPYRTERPVLQADIDKVKAARIGLLRRHAITCSIIAELVPYIVANAAVSAGTLTAHVTNQSLGVTPNPNLALTAILPPAVYVDLPLVGAGTLT